MRRTRTPVLGSGDFCPHRVHWWRRRILAMANTATAKAATDAPPWGRGLHNLHVNCCNRNRYQHHQKDNRHNLLGRHFSLNTLLVSECVWNVMGWVYIMNGAYIMVVLCTQSTNYQGTQYVLLAARTSKTQKCEMLLIKTSGLFGKNKFATCSSRHPSQLHALEFIWKNCTH